MSRRGKNKKKDEMYEQFLQQQQMQQMQQQQQMQMQQQQQGYPNQFNNNNNQMQNYPQNNNQFNQMSGYPNNNNNNNFNGPLTMESLMRENQMLKERELARTGSRGSLSGRFSGLLGAMDDSFSFERDMARQREIARENAILARADDIKAARLTGAGRGPTRVKKVIVPHYVPVPVYSPPHMGAGMYPPMMPMGPPAAAPLVSPMVAPVMGAPGPIIRAPFAPAPLTTPYGAPPHPFSRFY